jgi:hypothetical protein
MNSYHISRVHSFDKQGNIYICTYYIDDLTADKEFSYEQYSIIIEEL